MFKDKAVIKIILLGIFFRLIFFSLLSGVSWDSPRYLEQASNLLHGQIGQSQSEFGQIGRFILPPLYPLLIAVLSLFARSELLSGKLISLLSSVAVIGLTFHLGRLLFSERVGKYAALFVALYPQFWQDAGEVVIEPIFTLFLLFTFLSFWYATKTKKNYYFFWTGILSGFSALIKPVSIPIFIFLALSYYLFHKIRFAQLFYLVCSLVIIYGSYTLWITKTAKSDLYYYPKSVLAESFYLEGTFPDAFLLNSDSTTLKFMDNGYTHQSFIMSRPLTYLFLTVQSVTAGINYLFIGNIILTILSYFTIRHFISADYFSSWKKNAYLSGYIIIPIISSAVFYSLLLTHKNFMGRMDDPVLPLYFILSAAGIAKVHNDFKKIDTKICGFPCSGIVSLVVIFIFSSLAINVFYPMVRNAAIYGSGRFILRKEFVAQSAKKMDSYKKGTVMTSLADGRSIAYLAGRSIVYFPQEKSLDRVYHYASANDVCCIIIDKEITVNSDNYGIKLADIWEPFEGSQYKLYFYTL